MGKIRNGLAKGKKNPSIQDFPNPFLSVNANDYKAIPDTNVDFVPHGTDCQTVLSTRQTGRDCIQIRLPKHLIENG
jgi:hypothetical protein